MAKKGILKDLNGIEILPLTRGELILDSSGQLAFHSNDFLATTSLPGLMSADDKQKLTGIIIDDALSTTSTNPVLNKVVTNEINDIKKEYLKSATVDGNTLTIVDLSDSKINFYNTTYDTFLKETAASTGGRNGLVPKPDYNSGSKTRFLREDGTWVVPNNTTYTFTDGTDGSFSVTPSGGSKQTVSIGKPATAGTADKVANKLTLQINAGNVDGTSKYTYDGSTALNLNIVEGDNITFTTLAGKLIISSSYEDTHYTTHLYVGAKDNITNATTTNGNTYLKLYDDITLRHLYNIKGTGRVTVASDSSGNITINTPTTIEWSNVSNKPDTFTPSSHNHPTSQITALTSYSKASEASDLTTSDTLNSALGKLEYKADAAYDFYKSITGSDTDTVINKWEEIVDFVDSVAEGTDITDEFVTRKTALTITGEKTFSTLQKFTVADGTSPFTVTSKTLVTNLNADLLDGVHASGLLTALTNVNTTANPNSILLTVGGTSKYLLVAYAAKANLLTNNLVLKINSGTTEGTTLYTYNGSNAKTLDIVAGSNVTFTTASGKLTIESKNDNTTYTLSGDLSSNNYIVTLTPSSGTATTATVPAMTGATSSDAGKAGLVPAPASGKNLSFLRGDGTWAVPTNTWREIQINGNQLASTSITSYALNFISGTGITVSGTAGSSSAANKITITNAGVRSVTIGTGDNANKLAVDTNGDTSYLTIPYATLAASVTCTASTDNIDRPIVLTNTANKLYYSTKATINYSTGHIQVGALTSSGLVTLYSSSGDSPHLYFLRGTTSDGTYDWDLYVTSGYMKFRYNNAGTWTEVLSLYPGNNTLEGYKILTTGNSSVNGGGSSWGDSITVDIGGTSKTLTIPNKPTLSVIPSGSGNAVTSISVSDHTITVNKDSTFSLSEHTHSLYYDSTVSRTANTVLAAPNGSNGSATFRKLVSADMPTGVFRYLGYNLDTSTWGDGSGNNGLVYINTTNPSSINAPFSYGSIFSASASAASWMLGVSSGGTLSFRHRWWSGNGNDWSTWKTIAFTSDIPSIPSITATTDGSGNAVTSITASGHSITITKGSTFSLSDHTHSDYITTSALMIKGSYAKIPTYNGETGWHRIATIDAGSYGYGSWILYICGSWSYAANTTSIVHINTMHTSARLTHVSGYVGFITQVRLVNVSANQYYVDVYVNYSGSNTPGSAYFYFLGQGKITPNTTANKITSSVTATASITLKDGGFANYATSAGKLGSDTLGGTYQPIYLSSGTATAGTSYAKAITSISRSDTTFTYTCLDGTTGTFTLLDNNTDTKVTQTLTTANASYPLLLAPSGLTATTTTTSCFDSGVTLNPSTNTIEANISGSAGYTYRLIASSITNVNTPNWKINGISVDLFNSSASNKPYTNNNANGVINFSFGKHGVSSYYGFQLALCNSSTSARLYFRQATGGSSTTSSFTSWQTIAFTSDIPTVPTVTDYYWANVKVSASSSTTTTPTFSKVTISYDSFPGLQITRSGSTKGALIGFSNSNGVLGGIGMTGTVNSGLKRYTADYNTTYTICDTGNTSFTQSLTSGTEIGTLKIAGTDYTLYCLTNTNTDTMVTLSKNTTANYRPVVLGYASSATAGSTTLYADQTNITYTTNTIYALPSTGYLYATRMYTTSGYYASNYGVLAYATSSSGWTGADTTSIVVGTASLPTIIRSSGNDLYHYNNTLGAKYIILDTFNYTSYVKKLGTSTVGSATKGIYLNEGTATTMTYSLNATVNSGTASALAYYSGTNAISALTSSKGSYYEPIYLSAGVPTTCYAKSVGTVTWGTNCTGVIQVYQFGPITILLGYISKIQLSNTSSSSYVFKLPDEARSPSTACGFSVVLSDGYENDRNTVIILNTSKYGYCSTYWNDFNPSGNAYYFSAAYI